MWYLAAAVVWLLFLIGWYTGYFHAMQPKNGTLEWIQMYDRQSFSFLSARLPLNRQDILWLAGCVLVSGAAWAWRQNGLQPLSALTAGRLVLRCGLPALASAGVYLLSRLLGGVPLISALSAGTMALCFAAEPAVGVLIWSLVLLYGWMCQPAAADLWQNALWLLPAGLLLSIAVVLEPACWWLLPVTAVFWLVVLVQRWRAGFTWGRVLLAVCMSLLLLAVAVLGFLICSTIRENALQWTAMPQALWNGAFGQALAQVKGSLLRTVYCTPSGQLFQILLENCGVVLAGLFACAALAVQLLRQRSTQAAFLLGITVGAAAAFVLGAAYVLPVALLADVAHVCTLLWRREQKTAAVLLPALMLAIEVGNQFLG